MFFLLSTSFDGRHERTRVLREVERIRRSSWKYETVIHRRIVTRLYKITAITIGGTVVLVPSLRLLLFFALFVVVVVAAAARAIQQ